MNPLKDALPPKGRKIAYIAYVLLGVIIGAFQIIYDTDPTWLVKTFNVWAYLGLALGLTAASNVTTSGPEVAAADETASASDLDLHEE